MVGGVIRTIVAALFAVAMLVAPAFAGDPRPCAPGAAMSHHAAAAHHGAVAPVPCPKPHPSGAHDDACCAAGCVLALAFIDPTPATTTPMVGAGVAAASDAWVPGRSIPPPLGPPRS